MFASHLAAVLLSAFALWSMRHEISERATTRFFWALPVLSAAAAAAILLVVSPGRRPELWIVAIGLGFAAGLGAGLALTPIKDFARKLVLIHRTWDGVAVTLGLLVVALTRLVTTDFMGRQSHGFGVLGGVGAFLAAYLVGRLTTLQLYSAPKSIHLDMVEGERRRRN
ncbi:MAG TPA: hypothetical protein VMI56_12330 [Reyranella sp.]|nr:hypothetical protein [Reyranella sp.]